MHRHPRITVITPTIRPEYINITNEALKNQTFKDFEWIIQEGKISDGFQLPKDLNRALKKASGKIIVSLQDCISVSPNFLEKISKLDFNKKAYTFPMTKEGTEGDWRVHMNGEVKPDQWEIDLAACSKDLFTDVGGFDEFYCGGWSYDNVEIARRAAYFGYIFYCDNTIKGTAIDHDAIIEHPFRKKLIPNRWKLEITQEKIDKGEAKLEFL